MLHTRLRGVAYIWGMEIAEAKELKKELEKSIVSLISDYNSKTGMYVSHIDLEYIESQPKQSNKEFLIANVEVTLNHY